MGALSSNVDKIVARHMEYIEKHYKDETFKGDTFGSCRSIKTKTGVCKHCGGGFGYKTAHPVICPKCKGDPAIGVLYQKPGNKGPRMRGRP